MLYQDGTVISHFEDIEDACMVAEAMGDVTPGRRAGREPEI